MLNRIGILCFVALLLAGCAGGAAVGASSAPATAQAMPMSDVSSSPPPATPTTGASAAASPAASGSTATPTTAPASGSMADTAATTTGTYRGSTASGVTTFKGIPYAAPPVGLLRWKPPQPLASVPAGVVPATTYGNICYQHMDALYAVNGGTNTNQSEDCLYLNVYAPSGLSGKKPVDVWIHRGGYTTGHGDQDEGTQYAQHGIVFVNLNYRLHIFGYFVHPGLDAESPQHTSGNYGQLDQVAALKWVQANIAKFGGDPNNVTIHGQSAGAGAIAAHLVSPLTSGLFHRAIIESPYATQRPWSTTRELEAYYAANWAPYAQSIATLRAMSGAALNAAAPPGAGLLSPETTVYEPSTFNPTVDGYYLTLSDRAAYKLHEFHQVDVLGGNCDNEGFIFASAIATQYETQATFPTFLTDTYGSSASKATPLYPIPGPTDPTLQTGYVYGDEWFNYGVRQVLNYQGAGTSNVWRYVIVSPGSTTPATHSCELSDEFPNGGTPGDPGLSAVVVDTFSQFIKTGNPNGSMTNVWPAYGSDAAYLEVTLAGVMTPKTAWREPQLQFVDDYTNATYPTP